MATKKRTKKSNSPVVETQNTDVASVPETLPPPAEVKAIRKQKPCYACGTVVNEHDACHGCGRLQPA